MNVNNTFFGYKYFGFSAPCNDIMLSIISLFLEIFVLGTLIMFIISFLLLYIYDCFSFKNERFLCMRNQLRSNGSSDYFNGGLDDFLSVRYFLLSFGSSFFINIANLIEHYFLFCNGRTRVDFHRYYNNLYPKYHQRIFTRDILDSNWLYDYSNDRFSMFETEAYFDFHNVPVYFTSEEESFLDSLFLIMPTIMVLFILIPTLGFLYNTDLDIEQISPAFGIDVIGHQWYWTYDYSLGVLGKHITFDSLYDTLLSVGAEHRIDWLAEFKNNNYFDVDRHLLIPTNTNILLTLTSTDVIHSWAVPQLGIKVDAVPGKLSNTILFTYVDGLYFGQCSELCGVYHGFMPICVEAVPSNLFFCWCMATYFNETGLYFKPIIEGYDELEIDYDSISYLKSHDLYYIHHYTHYDPLFNSKSY